MTEQPVRRHGYEAGLVSNRAFAQITGIRRVCMECGAADPRKGTPCPGREPREASPEHRRSNVAHGRHGGSGMSRELRKRIAERTMFFLGELDDGKGERWLQHDGAGNAWTPDVEVLDLLALLADTPSVEPDMQEGFRRGIAAADWAPLARPSVEPADRNALGTVVMAALNEHGGSYRLVRDPADLAWAVADAVLAAFRLRATPDD